MNRLDREISCHGSGAESFFRSTSMLWNKFFRSYILGKNRKTRFETYKVAKYRLYALIRPLGNKSTAGLMCYWLLSKERYEWARTLWCTKQSNTKSATIAWRKWHSFRWFSPKTPLGPCPVANRVVSPKLRFKYMGRGELISTKVKKNRF